ncbi:VOC family protein [Kribbella pittospori]|uniref:VOC family protein n=1 Tax=Kribbella pittospori TaxID=722689 RepID=UPI0013F4B627|nr:VOC family protein [Kribbella pittospori]
MTNPVTIELQNVVFACPGNTEESYERGARPLAEFYANLLGMRIIREDWFLIADEDDPDGLHLGFGDSPIDYQPPRWPDPAYPQQMHLDITVNNLDAAEQRVLQLGASKLQHTEDFRTYADPASHPFCLYPNTETPTNPSAQIARVVIDCFSPRALADFYADLLDMPNRELDTPERVVITRTDRRLPALAFQHAQFPAPRWPDPAYPQQVHLDLRVPAADEPSLPAARSLANGLGAIELRPGPHHHVYADPAAHPFCL